MVFKNKAVKSFDLSALFTDHFVGNYIPLTMLVHALSWLLFKTNDGGHHAVNILFHIVNGILVFELGKRLFKNKSIAELTTLIFLLHPIQLESVGWISELKTVISSTFYLWASLCYIKYIESGQKKHWLYTIVLFVFACLSKSSAVVLPLSLIIFDFLLKPGTKFGSLVNKIPFLVLSLLFGLINIKTQSADLFINYAHAFPYHERVGFAGYALMKYTLLFLLPTNLSVIYPYPQATLPALISGYAFVLLIASFIFISFRKNYRFKLATVLFILTNLILVLQFIPFGEVLYADRYMYMPLVGFGWLFCHLIDKVKLPVKVVAVVLTLVLAFFSIARSNVWKSATSLYENILVNFPNSFVALNSVGVEHMLHNNDEKALYYMNKSISVSPNNYKGYYNRGLLYLKKQEPNMAIKSFNESIKIYEYPKAYVGRGSAYQVLGDIPKAVEDAKRALVLDKNNITAHFILGNCYNDQNDLVRAMQEFNTCIERNSEEPDYYFKRAIVFGKKQDFASCLNDLELCTYLKPEYSEAYYWKGVAKINLKQAPCSDFKIAAQQNFGPAVTAYNKYCR